MTDTANPVESVIETLKGMTALQLSELKDQIEEVFGAHGTIEHLHRVNLDHTADHLREKGAHDLNESVWAFRKADA